MTRAALPAIIICLALNATVATGIVAHRPAYLRDYQTADTPDARDYLRLGRNLVTQGRFSRCEQAPFVADIVRTPVYPALAGLLVAAGGPAAIYAFQTLLQVGTCLLLARIVGSLWGHRAAFWSSLLLGTDMMLAVSNFEALTEPLFVFLLLAACDSLLPVLLLPPTPTISTRRRLLFGGLLLGAAILTRPAALYIPLIFAAILILEAIRLRTWSGRLAKIGLLLVFAYVPVGLWIARNAIVFSVPRVTTVDANNMVYFVGAGAYQVRHHLSLEDAQARISHEYGLPPYAVLQNPWITDRTVASMDRQIRSVQGKVVARYPRELVISSVLGVAKASFSHNVVGLALLWNRHWDAPGTAALLRLQPAALDRLRANGPVLTAAFVWQLFHTIAALGVGFVGMALVLKNPEQRREGFYFATLYAYFMLTVALFGLEAYYRCRIPVLPFLYAFGGYGLAQLAGAAMAMSTRGASAKHLEMRESVAIPALPHSTECSNSAQV